MTHTLEQKRINTQKKRDERRVLAFSLLGDKCTMCGSESNLEFDHIDPATKQHTISSIWTSKLEIFLKEIDKCQLLCHECHVEKSRLNCEQSQFRESNGSHKLTTLDVMEINWLRSNGDTIKSLAEQYKVHRTTICRAKLR